MTSRKQPALERPEMQGSQRSAEEEQEKVGYGRPPVGTRFKPGESGNPRGRPKGSKGIDQVLRQALERRVPDPRGGRRTVRMLDVIVEGVVLSAARRDPRMLRLLLTLIDRYGPNDPQRIDPDELRNSDRQILDEFIASIAASGPNPEDVP